MKHLITLILSIAATASHAWDCVTQVDPMDGTRTVTWRQVSANKVAVRPTDAPSGATLVVTQGLVSVVITGGLVDCQSCDVRIKLDGALLTVPANSYVEGTVSVRGIGDRVSAAREVVVEFPVWNSKPAVFTFTPGPGRCLQSSRG